MGVKDLWPILEPVKQHTPLSSLRGKTVAVDLSIWIVSNQGVKQLSSAMSKPHIRNLFFRVSTLQQLGVKLIFVVDGDAPVLKGETIDKRLKIRRGITTTKKSADKHTDGKLSKPKKRTGLNILIRECLGLLDAMGVPYIYSKAEAEAMCALLNSEGIVDGCITDDGDVFLYGARTVYRNFTLDKKDPHVDLYNMSDIETMLGLDRVKMIAMGLLLGCDYIPRGVPGVGKEQALKLMLELGDINVLTRFQDWKTGKHRDQGMMLKKVTHCSTCHHPGSLREHKSNGCVVCKSRLLCYTNTQPCTCAWHIHSEQAGKHKLEISIMNKLCAIEDYPMTEVIDEFLNQNETVPHTRASWKHVDIPKLQRYLSDKLDWPERYTLEKSLPLLTHWILSVKSIHTDYTALIEPQYIVKHRVQQKQECLQVKWHLPDAFMPEDCESDSDLCDTIESLLLFGSAYPHMLASFLDEKEQLKQLKGKKPRTKKTEAVPSIPTISPLLLDDEENDDFSKLVSDMSQLGVKSDNGLCENNGEKHNRTSCVDAGEENDPAFYITSGKNLDKSSSSSSLENSELECELPPGVGTKKYEQLYLSCTGHRAAVEPEKGFRLDERFNAVDESTISVNDSIATGDSFASRVDASMDLFSSPTPGEMKQTSPSYRGGDIDTDVYYFEDISTSPPPSTPSTQMNSCVDTTADNFTQLNTDSPLPLAIRLLQRRGTGLSNILNPGE